MSNFELTEDYLMNRLSGEGRIEFEKQMEMDASLRADIEIQRTTIDAIRTARMMDLKSMLNNVPIPTSPALTGSLAAKVIGSIISAGFIGILTYTYLNNDITTESVEPDPAPQTEITVPLADSASVAVIDNTTSNRVVEEAQPSENKPTTATNQSSSEQTARPVPSPRINVIDPAIEVTEPSNNPALSGSQREVVTPSQIEINTDSSNKRYSFHYQLGQGKLQLYGTFDKGLYEVLEVNGSAHTVFLFYDDKFYLLIDKNAIISPLEPVTDQTLIRKLREYRNK